MRRRIRHKRQLYPDLYDLGSLPLVRSIRDFDEHFTAVHCGYAGADDYYTRASALPLIKHIRLPTLIVHAQDDPFVPFASFRNPLITDNPRVVFLAPEHGGHVGFVAEEARKEDRFWVENRIVQFCDLLL